MLVRFGGLVIVLLALVTGATFGSRKIGRQGGCRQSQTGRRQEKAVHLGLEDKSERTFLVSKETKFTGPHGADHEEGLKNPCMGDGYEVRVVPAQDATIAKEVKLSAWKPETKKKKG